MFNRPPAPPQLAQHEVTPDHTAELARLELQAQLHEQTADALLALRQSRPKAPPPTETQFQTDRAALILVYEANRHVQENRPADAVASYRRAIELFPQSHWAQVARQRLKDMQT